MIRILRILLLVAAANVVADEPIRVCYEDKDFPPFLLGNSEQQVEEAGMLPELIHRSAKTLGMTIEYQRLPWKRCLKAVERGEIDALFAVIYTDARDSWAAYPKTNGKPDGRYLYLSEYPVFVSSGSALRWDGTQFTPSKPMVQSVPGYVAEQRLIDMGMKPVLPLQPRDAMPVVAAGRIDGYVVERLIGQQILLDLGLEDQIKTLTEVFLAQPWYLAFSKQRYKTDSEKIEAFWDEIDRQRESQGEALKQKYLKR